MNEGHLSVLRSFLHPGEIITPDSPAYLPKAQTWASQKQLNPRLIVRPATIETLSKLVAYLYSTDLDFAIYGHGFMSASATDVLINMSAFDGFHFDKYSELATIGAGQTWEDVYRKLRKAAPDYGSIILPSPSQTSITLTCISRWGTYSLCRGSRYHHQWWVFMAFGRVWMHL